MSTIIKMNKAVIAELFDKITSSANETEKLLADKGIDMSGVSNQSAIKINNNSYGQVRYIKNEPLPKDMEAHIIALIKGGLS
jgi:hypothetical protein